MMLRNCKLFAFKVGYNYPDRKPHPGGEMERTGTFSRAEVVFQVVATHRSIAHAYALEHFKFAGGMPEVNQLAVEFVSEQDAPHVLVPMDF